ncbi:MAG: EAL domain-containing protein [Pseudomonadota bacterium]
MATVQRFLFEAPVSKLKGALQNGTLNELRSAMSVPILVYYWTCCIAVLVSGLLLSVPIFIVTIALIVIGSWATHSVRTRPGRLQTRLTLTVAINATWMFGLYVASHVYGGAFMLEVHMFYFINTAIILAFACWKSVVLTTVAALLHHLVLSTIQPSFVWPGGSFPWIHFANHSFLGVLNCIGACLIAASLKSVVSRSEKIAAEMRDISVNEPLTNLLNRRGFFAQLDDFFASKATSGQLAIMAIDLDGFKQINDTAGHAVGDTLLQLVARQLLDRAPQDAIIARMGGDEFVLAIPDWDKSDVRHLAEPFLEWTRQPCVIDGREVRFGASIGVAIGSSEATQIDALLVDADIALYAAKTRGKNCVAFFDAEMRDRTLSTKALEDDVLRGLEAGEFVPFYQTQHDSISGRLVGLEALARWNHPSRGTLEPSEFLSAVQDIGRMAQLDNLMLHTACRDVRHLEALGHDVHELSVNVSFSRLHDPNLKAEIDDLPRMHARLMFEIVETVILDDMSTEQNMMLDAMREQGIGITIDDFGTGHASIIALTQILPDKLKIDQKMVTPAMNVDMHESMLRSILKMVGEMNIKTVAEGVEHEDEAKLLADMGVDQLQGFLFSRPMPLDDLIDHLSRAEPPGQILQVSGTA